MKRRLLSVFLSMCMVLTLLPAAVLAAGDGGAGYTFEVNAPAELTVNQEYTGASVTLKGSDGAESCQAALIKVQITQSPEGSSPRIMATDTQGQAWNLAEVGQWGPPEGFPVAAGYDVTTGLTLTFDKEGEYTAVFQLVDLSNGNAVLAEASCTVNVTAEEHVAKLSSVSVVDGTDGFTPVTVPAVGQKLTANITAIDKDGSTVVIGSHPVNPDASYKWYYEDSPDTVLGTEPVYTVTSDNTGKVLCVDVDVSGYAGGPLTWKAEGAVSTPAKLSSVSVEDGTDGFTPVTVPAVGQKLTANITAIDKDGSTVVIGSHPVNPDASYKWYYEDSPDTVLGTEPVYTVTSDNTGKVLCVDVDVSGYAGGPLTWKAEGAVVRLYVITLDANGGTVPSSVLYTDAEGVLDSLPTPTRSGSYDFDGWYTASSGGGRITAPHTFTEDTTLYAHWSYSGGGSGGGGGGSSSSSSYAITVEKATGGAVKVSSTRADKGDTVTITVTSDSGYVLDTLTVTDKNGDKVALTDRNDGTYTFTMPGSKVTVQAAFVKSEAQTTLSFTDVPADAYYYDAVRWAVENGVTTGTSATTFAPDGVCTRAQVVTFLWRVNGSPAPTAAVSPFADVSVGSYYYDAVLWAVEQGITSGTSTTTFSPEASCTRAQVATFLWRTESSPAVSGGASFADVADNTYYTNAVIWAANSGVTSGTSATTFSPDAVCTRAQIVTFLYRALA